jgi:hypothetical protein
LLHPGTVLYGTTRSGVASVPKEPKVFNFKPGIIFFHRACIIPVSPRRIVMSATLLAASLLIVFPSALADPCTYWYETTVHGTSFRNVHDFGAIGDGIHDDTSAIQAAFDFNQTGGAGSNLAKSPAIVYLPPGDYLISDTLVMWYYGHLVGNAACPPTLRLGANSPGFGGPSMKPVLAAAGGFNVSTASHAWWLQGSFEGGAANCLFYVHARDFSIVVGAGNDGAVGIFWDVAQQTSVRSVTIDLRQSGAIGIDEGGSGYVATPSTGAGGGGTLEDISILGGTVGLRVDASQVRDLGSFLCVEERAVTTTP